MKFYRIREENSGKYYAGHLGKLSKFGKVFHNIGHAKTAITQHRYYKIYTNLKFVIEEWEATWHQDVEYK